MKHCNGDRGSGNHSQQHMYLELELPPNPLIPGNLLRLYLYKQKQGRPYDSHRGMFNGSTEALE